MRREPLHAGIGLAAPAPNWRRERRALLRLAPPDAIPSARWICSLSGRPRISGGSWRVMLQATLPARGSAGMRSFSADPHDTDERIIGFCARPRADATKMKAALGFSPIVVSGFWGISAWAGQRSEARTSFHALPRRSCHKACQPIGGSVVAVLTIRRPRRSPPAPLSHGAWAPPPSIAKAARPRSGLRMTQRARPRMPDRILPLHSPSGELPHQPRPGHSAAPGSTSPAQRASPT